MISKSKKGAFLRRAALAGTALSFVALAPAFASGVGSNTSTWVGAPGSGTTVASATSGANSFTVGGVGVTTKGTNANVVITTGSDGLQVASGQTLTITAEAATGAATAPNGISTLIVDNSGTASDIAGALIYNVSGVTGGAKGAAGIDNLYIANQDGVTVGAAGSINVNVAFNSSGANTYTNASSIYLEGYNATSALTNFNGSGALGIGNGTGNITVASGASFNGYAAGKNGTGTADVIVAGAGSINIGTSGATTAVSVANGGSLNVYAGLQDNGTTSAAALATGAVVTINGTINTTGAGNANVYGQESIVANNANLMAPANGTTTGTLNLWAGYTAPKTNKIAGSSSSITLAGDTTVADLVAMGNVTVAAGSTVVADGAIYAGGTFTNNSGAAGSLTLVNNEVTAFGGLVNTAGSQLLWQASGQGGLTLSGGLNNAGIFNIQTTNVAANNVAANTADSLLVQGNLTNSGLLRSVASNFAFGPYTTGTANADSGLTIALGTAQGIGGYNFINTGTINVAGYAAPSTSNGTTTGGVINPNLSILAGNIDLQGFVQSYDSAASTSTGLTATSANSVNADLGDLTLLATNGLSWVAGPVAGTSVYSGINTGVIDFNTQNVVNVVSTLSNAGFMVTAGAVRFLSGGLVDNGISATTSAAYQSNNDAIITGSNNHLKDPFTGATLNYALSVFPGVSVLAGANDIVVDTQVDESSASGSVGNNGTSSGSASQIVYTYGNVNDVGMIGSAVGNATFVVGSMNASNDVIVGANAGIEVGNGESLTFDFAGNLNNPQGPAENGSTWVYNYLPVSIGNVLPGSTGAINLVLNPVGAAGNYMSNPYVSGAGTANNAGPYGLLTPGGIGVGNNTNNTLAAQMVNLIVNGDAYVYTGDTGSATEGSSTTSWGVDPAYGSAATFAYNSHLVVQATGNVVIAGSSEAATGRAVSNGAEKNPVIVDVANYQSFETSPAASNSVGGANADTTYWPGLVYLRNAGAFSGTGVTSINAAGLISLNANLDNATYSTLPTANGGNGITFASDNLVNLDYNFIMLAANGSLSFTSQALSNTLATDFGQYVLQGSQGTPAGTISWSQLATSGYTVGSNL